MEKSLENVPAIEFPNVVTLEQQAEEHHVRTDVPDTQPEEELAPPKVPLTAAPTPPPQ